MQLNPKFAKAYYRHSKALAYKNKLGAALDVLKQCLAKDKTNEEIQGQIAQIEAEIQLDNAVPKDD